MSECGSTNIEPVDKKRKLLKACSNPACGNKSENCRVAPYFVCAYFHLQKESKKQKRVCPKCYMEAESHQTVLVERLKNGEMVFDFNERGTQPEVVALDEEESSEEEESADSNEVDEVVEIEDNFDKVLKSLMEKYNFKEQVDSAISHLGKQH